MGVTAIKYFLNQSALPVKVHNHENHRRYTVAPGQSCGMDEWIPWAVNSRDFDENHFIEVRLSLEGKEDPVFAIWQYGETGTVRFHQHSEQPQWDDRGGTKMNGVAQCDGNRALRMLKDNTVWLDRAG